MEPIKLEVGKTYANNIGAYQVLAIGGPKMRVRYEHGEVAILTVAVQQRIASRNANMAAEEKRRKATAEAHRKADVVDGWFSTVY